MSRWAAPSWLTTVAPARMRSKWRGIQVPSLRGRLIGLINMLRHGKPPGGLSMSPTAAFLADRGVVRVEGEDAPAFLQGLLTNDVVGLAAGEARYAALLTPQGKILFDFL